MSWLGKYFSDFGCRAVIASPEGSMVQRRVDMMNSWAWSLSFLSVSWSEVERSGDSRVDHHFLRLDAIFLDQ